MNIIIFIELKQLSNIQLKPDLRRLTTVTFLLKLHFISA